MLTVSHNDFLYTLTAMVCAKTPFYHAPAQTDIPSEEVRLTSKLLRRLGKELDRPVYTGTIGKKKIHLYIAKQLYTKKWRSPLLKRLVGESRKTYRQFYGELPIFDSYDEKSAVYLLSVTYPLSVGHNQVIQIKEWFSLRFVPANKAPLRTEDIDFYVTHEQGKKRSVIFLLQKYLPLFKNTSEKEILEKIVTISRFCAIRPYAVKESEQVLLEEYQHRFVNPTRNEHSTLAFSLINKHFFSFCKEKNLSFQLVTCQMHPKMTTTILSYPPRSGKNKMHFVPLAKLLGLKTPLVLDRKNPKVYVFQYPGYFFALKELVSVLQRAIRDNILKKETIERYLDHQLPLSVFFRKPHLYDFRFMGKLFSHKGMIKNEVVTGSFLRQYINTYVPDGVVLYVMHLSDWEKSVHTMIEYIYRMEK